MFSARRVFRPQRTLSPGDEVIEAHPFRSNFDAVQLGGLCHPFSPLSSFPHGLGVKSLSPTDFPVSPVDFSLSPVDFSLGAVVKTVSPIDFSLGATDFSLGATDFSLSPVVKPVTPIDFSLTTAEA